MFEPRPRLKYDPRKAAVLQQSSKNTVITFETALNREWTSALKELSSYSNFKIFDQAIALLRLGCGQVSCFDGHTQTGHLIYRDSTHLTDLGAKAIFESFNTWYRQSTNP